MVDVIANLATATASDSATIAQLTVTVARLMTEIVMVNVNLVVALQTNRAIRGGREGRDRTSRGRGSGSGAGSGTGTGSGAPEITGASMPTISEVKDLEPPIYYRWTCGPGCRYNSAKCTVPADGHIYTATKRNMQVGAEATQ